jgi:hypothetical protein
MTTIIPEGEAISGAVKSISGELQSVRSNNFNAVVDFERDTRQPT